MSGDSNRESDPHASSTGGGMPRRIALGALGALVAPFVLGIPGCTGTRGRPSDGLMDAPEEPVVHLEGDGTPFPTFVEEPGLRGTVRAVGSSAVGLVLNAARPLFREVQPDVELRVISSGSGEGPRALAAGEADLASMSRPMRPAEIEAIERANGVKVASVDLALDAISLIVNKANPLTRISLRDIDRIFGRERKRGGAPASRWGELGVVGGDGAAFDKPITLYGMNAGSGSYGIVQEVVLEGGAFRTSVNEEPVSSSVVQAVATDPGAIGYCSSYFMSPVFKTGRLRELEVQTLDGSGFLRPTSEAVRSGRYPLSRRLRVYYLADLPRRNPAAAQFLRFLLSQDGQEFIAELGQRTILPSEARTQFARLEPR